MQVDFCHVKDAMRDFRKEFSKWCQQFYIFDKEFGFVQFKLNDCQQIIFKNMHNRIVLLKPRQIGGTTIARVIILYFARKIKNSLWGVISFKEEEGTHEIAALKQLIHNENDVTGEKYDCDIKVDENIDYSRVFRIWPSGATFRVGSGGTKSPLRGKTLTGALATEAAYWTKGRSAFASFEKAVVKNGIIVIESTPLTKDDLFYDKYTEAKREKAPTPQQYQHVFVAWHDHKDYRTPVPKNFKPTAEELELKKQYNLNDGQLCFRREQLPGYPNYSSSALQTFLQEYPSDDISCWETAGRPLFQTDRVNQLEILPPRLNVLGCDEKFWVNVQGDMKYFMGVDTAKGVGGDKSALVVVDENAEICCIFDSKNVGYELFSSIILKIARYYDAFLYIETTYGLGVAVHDIVTDSYAGGKVMGFETQVKSKVVLYNAITRWFRDHNRIKDVDLQSELAAYDTSKTRNRDDLIESFGLSLLCREDLSFATFNPMMRNVTLHDLERKTIWQKR